MQRFEKEKSALAPYRVLDMTDESGAYCTKILAAHGADVIRVEPPGGDPTRRIGPFYHDEPDLEKSLYWFTYNMNERSVTLDIESDSGKELFKRLVKTAHFLVECFRPGYLDKLGLGYDALSAINPGLVMTSITPFGATGPYSQFKGSNLVCGAMSGYVFMTGDDDRPPVQISAPMAYTQNGLEAAASTMVAHWYRRKTGIGQHIDVSVQESIMAQFLPNSLAWKSHHFITSRTRQGPTRMHGGRTPEIFQCKDGLVVGATSPARGREPIREWMGSKGMAGDLYDKEWDDVYLRGANVTLVQKTHIDALFQAFVANYTRDELMKEAQARDIQVVKMHDVKDIMNDPHLKERECFVTIDYPELNDTITINGSPFKSKEMTWSYYRRAPFIGEHNKEIYMNELGLSAAKMAILKEGGII